MKKIILISIPILVCINHGISLCQEIPVDWPVLKKYETSVLSNIAIPVGGIGTGTISLGGIGDLKDWGLMNRPAIGFVPQRGGTPFFAISINMEGKKDLRLLEGPLGIDQFAGYDGSRVPNYNMPRFAESSFWTTYPFGRVNLSDPDIPLDVALEVYNPFIPGNEDLSGLPVMPLIYKVKNNTDEPIRISICGTIPNFIGNDGWHNEERRGNGRYFTTGEKNNKNEFRKEGDLQGIYMYSEGVEKMSPSWGTMALTTFIDQDVSWQLVGSSKAQFYNDFKDDGLLEPKQQQPNNDSPAALLAISKEVEPGQVAEFPFFITWHFPNRQDWTSSEVVGNYYTTQYIDAWDAALKVIPQLTELRKKTIGFVSAFVNSSYPDVVKEAALFNLSTLRSSTCFRTPDGYLFGWEGSFNRGGCCWGNSTHVYNYEQATPFLFGSLSKTMRYSEFKYATDDHGMMSYRIGLPLETQAQKSKYAAADGQMGCIMKLYRDWQLSGDNQMLADLWPKTKKALEFCWVPGGWDSDKDGVMEGCQHNTMDVEYFGPNPQMGFWYLGALKAGKEMASFMGDKDFANTCEQLFNRGSHYMDANLFNGEYYIQQIEPSPKAEDIYPGLFARVNTRLLDKKVPAGQLGNGCLIDQTIGQYMSHLCGLGYLADQNNIKSALLSILKRNYRDGYDYFSDRRSFRMLGEPGIIMADYGDEPRSIMQMGYSPETMTGFEYALATSLIYEGKTNEAVKVYEDVRSRFDGVKRSPFHEAEAGYHYSRAMASWSAIPALSGFHYSGVEKKITFTSKPGRYFWSNGYAWGTCLIEENRAELEIISGTLQINKINIKGVGTIDISGSPINNEGKIKIEF